MTHKKKNKKTKASEIWGYFKVPGSVILAVGIAFQGDYLVILSILERTF